MNKAPDTPEIAQKRAQEKRTMETMVRIFCRGNRHMPKTSSGRPGGRNGQNDLCPQCRALLDYANMRTDKCPFMAEKTFCSACKVHCYSKEMQENVRRVMRYAGPRMLFVHPVMAVRHMKVTLKNKRNSQRGG